MSKEGVTRIRIEAKEPYFAGHFPGDPLVPGVVVLEHVIDAISRRVGVNPSTSGVSTRVRRIDGVKFLAPLRPGDELDIELERLEAGTVRFICRCANRLIATGTIQASDSGLQS